MKPTMSTVFYNISSSVFAAIYLLVLIGTVVILLYLIIQEIREKNVRNNNSEEWPHENSKG